MSDGPAKESISSGFVEELVREWRIRLGNSGGTEV